MSVSRRNIVAGISAAAVLSQLPGAALAQNRAKKFVKPTVPGFNAAAAQANWKNAPNMKRAVANSAKMTGHQ